MNFWLSTAIQEAIILAEAYISNSKIKPGLKAALEKLIEAGNGVIAAIQAGN